MSAHQLCGSCADAWMRWLDYRPPAQIRIHNAGGDSLRSSLSRQKLRADDIYTTIRSQQALIRSICERLHTPVPGGLDNQQHIV